MFHNVRVTYKIILPYIAVITLILGGLLSWYVVRESENLEMQLLKKTQLVTTSLTDAAGQSVATREYSRLNDLLKKQQQADSDLLYITVVEKSGRILASTDSALHGQTAKPRTSLSEVALTSELTQHRYDLEAETYEVQAPITMFDVEMARIQVGVSEVEIHQRIQSFVMVLLSIGCGAAALGSLVFVGIIRRSVVTPLQQLSEASRRISGGDLDARVGYTSQDELGELGSMFNAMALNLNESRRELQEERDLLEVRVAERTQDLNQRNDDMRLVMDNVNQGFLTLDMSGVLSAERSAIVDTWFGEVKPGASLASYLEPINPDFAVWFEMGWDAITDGFLPLELCLEQLPNRITHNGQTLSFDFTPICDVNGEPEKFLVVISNITTVIERERMEVEQRETLVVFKRLMMDKAGFLEFFAEADSIVREILDESPKDLQVLKRHIHTLKGNAAIFGLNTVSTCCHTIETRMEEKSSITADERTELGHCWGRLGSNLNMLLGERKDANIELEDAEFEAILQAVLFRKPARVLARMIMDWKLEPTHRRLTRIVEQVRGLGRRMGKGELIVESEANGLRLDPERWADFWSSFVHVVRNAADHGLETPTERVAEGKSEQGSIGLRTFREANDFVVEIRDDGRGIDWEGVRVKAEEKGLPNKRHKDLVEAMFSDGLSTKQEVDELSGRGVGMSAVRQSCRALGGEIHVESHLGEGTCLQFRFPAASMVNAAAHEQLRMCS